MSTAPDLDLLNSDIEAYLHAHEQKSLLRFITCGSVDDGKSTLIGRLLYESHMVFEDQLAALERDSAQVGTQGESLDLALLVDGLAAEREQGITIDVAYRFFATDRRKFIVADTPGHEQYTRNMVTGASTADLAVILIDARKGVLTQTRRHSFLVSLMRIPQVVLAINKMDLVDFSQERYDEIEAAYRAFAGELGLTNITAIPVSALDGDNIVTTSERTPWYTGPTLLAHLETTPLAVGRAERSFRLPVQWVSRPNADFRGFAGTVVEGEIHPGDPVVVLPSGSRSMVARIVTADGDLDVATSEQAVTITLTSEVDVSRGDIICGLDDPAQVGSRLETTVVWMSEAPQVPERPYLIKIGPRTVPGRISQPQYAVDVNTMEQHSVDALELNQIGRCSITLDRPVAFDPYRNGRDTGGFIVIDRMTNATVAAGMIEAASPASDLHTQVLQVTKDAHVQLKGHKPAVLWLTGLSGAGKSTLANEVERRLHQLGVHTVLLDGDNIRQGLCSDLGFSDKDRAENIRRVAEVARLMADAGLVTLVSFISPFKEDRQLARERIAEGEFCEVYVDAPLSVAEGRDVKGLYAKARRGEIPQFTGVGSPYEAPEDPEVHVRTDLLSIGEAAEVVLSKLRDMGVLY